MAGDTGCDAEVTLPAVGGGAGVSGAGRVGAAWTLELDTARPGVTAESQERPDRVVPDADTTPSSRTGDGSWNGTGPYPVAGQSVVVFSTG